MLANKEDPGSKPTGTNSYRDSIEKTHHKKGLVEWLKVQALSSNSSNFFLKKERKNGSQVRFLSRRPTALGEYSALSGGDFP
jgi:hypothetical protein